MTAAPTPTVTDLERRYVLLGALRWLPVGLMVPIFVVLPTARGIPLTAVGPLLAAYSAAAIVLELPTGGMADRFGRRNVHVLASAVAVVGFALFGIAETVPAFLASLVVAGANRALLTGPVEAWFVDEAHAVDPTAPLDRAYARAESWAALALGAGALATALLPQVVSLPESGPGVIAPSLPVLIAVGAEAVHLVAAWLLLRPETRHATDASGTGPLTIRQTIRAAVRTARGPVLRRLLVAEALLVFAMVAGEQLVPADLVALLGERDAASTFGFLSAVGFGVVAGGARLAPRVADRLGPRQGYAAVLAFVAAVLVVPTLGASTPVLVVTYLLAYGSLGAQAPLRSSLLHVRVGPEQRATVLSVVSLLFQGGGLVASLVLLPIYDGVGRVAAWSVAAVAVAVGAGALGSPPPDEPAPDLGDLAPTEG